MSPVARAIRSALTMSAAALALTGPGIAFAGTPAAAPKVQIVRQAASAPGVADLTRVSAEAFPSSVVALGLTNDESVNNTVESGDVWGLRDDNDEAVIENTAPVSARTGWGTAHGLQASGYTSATIDNGAGGTITATSDRGSARGIVASGFHVDVDNAGAVTATGTYGAYAIEVDGYIYSEGGTIGAIDVVNAGALIAQTDGKYAMGIALEGSGDVNLDNSGSVTVSSGGRALGIYVEADGAATVVNGGDITVDGGTLFSIAAGIHVNADSGVSVTNSGDLVVNAKYATGIGGGSYEGDVIVNNSGSITLTSIDESPYGGGGVAGIGVASYRHDTVVVNSGDIAGIAERGAYGIQGWAADGDVTADNSGNITLESMYGSAAGIAVYGGSATVVNSGDLSVTGGASATGISVGAEYTALASNTGNIIVTQTNQYSEEPYGPPMPLRAEEGEAIGIDVYADGTATVSNDGGIVVTAFEEAIGIRTRADDEVAVTNSGDITATGYGATGIEARAWDDYEGIGNSATVTSTGDIVLEGVGGWAEGIVATGQEVLIGNGGDITATSTYWTIGIDAYGENVAITNTGDIAVEATGEVYGEASGIAAFGVQDVTVESTGAITATAAVSEANGILATSYAGTVDVANGGDIVASSYSYEKAFGIKARAYGDATVTNSGDITGTGHGAVGIDARVRHDYEGNGSSVTVTNTGTIVLDGAGDWAEGINATGQEIVIGNAGDIAATATYSTVGIDTTGEHVTITNSGDIAVEATGEAYGAASGIAAYGMQSVTVESTGAIIATATLAEANGIRAFSYPGMVDVANGGDIVVTSLKQANGIFAYAHDNVSVANAGDITVTQEGEVVEYVSAAITPNESLGMIPLYGGIAMGVNATSYYGDVGLTNFGEVNVEGNDVGIGLFSLGHGLAAIDNGGAVHASTGAEDGIAIAALVAGGNVEVGNSGALHATTSNGTAGGLFAMGGSVLLTSSGLIQADATGVDGQAIGAQIDASAGDANATITGGSIVASGATYATGLDIVATGGIVVDNAGLIGATGGTGMAALHVDGASATIHNIGTIAVDGDYDGSFAIIGNDAIETIDNAGSINGGLLTFGGDDAFTNSGVWNVHGTATDFGEGDDTLTNAAGGTVRIFDGAAMTFGGSVAGNAFDNAGTLAMNGVGEIDMGAGMFANTGAITLLDGVTDDILTIRGDFGGTGAVNVDVDLATRTSDQLVIDGSLLDGTRQSVNVSLLTMPTGSINGMVIPIVTVTGGSEGDEFISGAFTVDNVIYSQNNFLDLAFGVAPVAGADVAQFALTVDFGGLNDTGSLAASIASGVHHLMHTQVGTFRQRMGAFSAPAEGGNAWARVFRDKGTVHQTHEVANLPQGGHFVFDQTNTGIEAGFNVGVTDTVFVGASVAKSEGKQSLARGGVGSDEIDASALGVHVTYIAPTGTYADLSYRWMNFDAELRSLGGAHDTSGDAGALNIEAGFTAWTSEGGLKIVPQAQYTRTKVDNIETLHGDIADFTAEGGTSSRGRVGVEFQQTFKGASATWTPYASVNAVREMQGEYDFVVDDTFRGHTGTKGTSAMVEAGVSADIGGVSVFGGLNWTDGGALEGVFGGQVGVRYSW